MKRWAFLSLTLLLVICMSSCGVPDFNGSRLGNDGKLVMEYSIFNTTDSQLFSLERGDVVSAEIVSESGSINIVIQKDGDSPVYEEENVPTSSFQVKIAEGGTYRIAVTGQRARGSVSFLRCSEA